MQRVLTLDIGAAQAGIICLLIGAGLLYLAFWIAERRRAITIRLRREAERQERTNQRRVRVGKRILSLLQKIEEVEEWDPLIGQLRKLWAEHQGTKLGVLLGNLLDILEKESSANLEVAMYEIEHFLSNEWGVSRRWTL